HAVYYPFTSFSPEWQALRYALTHDIPARFIDLPQSIRLAQEIAAEASETTDAPEPPDEPERLPVADGVVDLVAEATPDAPQTQQTPDTDAPTVRDDPLALLAEAAGYTDHELWWEREVEQRQNANDLFEGILEAMTALRSDLAPNDEEALREAHMRQGIRAAEREGFSRIAVVCGAWHTPALAQRDDAKGDAAL